MARPDKVAAVAEVRDRLERSTATVLTEYRGLTVAELASLRAELRDTDAEYKVVKNTLTLIAARETGLVIPDGLLTGPTAVTFCAGDPVATAKVLRRFSRLNPELVVKGAILEGNVLSAAEALSLADLQSRDELLARLAGAMEAVVAQPARLALASLSKAARTFAALADKLADGQPDGQPPAAAEPAAVEPVTADAPA